MSINSYQVSVVFGLALGYIDEHKLVSDNRCIWFGSKVYC